MAAATTKGSGAALGLFYALDPTEPVVFCPPGGARREEHRYTSDKELYAAHPAAARADWLADSNETRPQYSVSSGPDPNNGGIRTWTLTITFPDGRPSTVPEAAARINGGAGVVRTQINPSSPVTCMSRAAADFLSLRRVPLTGKARSILGGQPFAVDMLAEPLRMELLGQDGTPVLSTTAPIVIVPRGMAPAAPAGEPPSPPPPVEQRMFELQLGRDVLLGGTFGQSVGCGSHGVTFEPQGEGGPSVTLPWLAARRQPLGSSTLTVPDELREEAQRVAAARPA